ncbi:PREDICTED: uncharacterized protein LOC106749811 [Dinoponera quadriceps]|uniref:Uncharacterized protein LOC106749811 n=1 Tax=Dinoponera quadriceps TaxID=609295 RepID=A0A6P3Y4C1_DINQU|nr:PREDICTED: uncharacterized protein LOC106749811 [Dinoponera quadriceps]
MATRRRIGAPGLTKTQAMRQARSAALVKEYEQKKETGRPQQVEPQVVVRRKHVVAEPKKVEFTKPTMTKAMLARVKHAEKFKQEYERKREEALPMRRAPRRTLAPVSGDARFGRERAARRAPTPSPPISPPREVRRPELRRPSPVRAELPPIPERTRELARTMNAQVIQAEPVGEGPIDSIVIPPRVVDENRTTIVSIPQPTVEGAEAVSEVANRSIQVISETLDEQDASEAATVQGKLEDLQQARRDFVMAVANVGGNAVQLAEEERPRYIQRVPDIEGEMFRIEYGREHPTVVAAREFLQRSMAGIREREREREAAREPLLEDLPPFEEEFLQDDIPWEELEEPHEEFYEYPTFDPERLERFFDVSERYLPSPPRGPPPGREHLHPDLWELEDPWAVPCQHCSRQDVSDLIRFDSP